MVKDKIAYGIDLGLTFSRASFINSNGRSQVISPGVSIKNSIPSCILYDNKKNDVKIGEAAVSSSKSSPSNFLYNSKRFLSKYYSDLSKKEIDSFPFKLIEKDNLLYYEIQHYNEIKQVNPIEVSSEILKYINKISLPQIIHDDVDIDDIHVVIGIPAHFNKQLREDTIEAARLAGLKKVELITEPSAAALAYISSNHEQIINKNDCNILVYDFGGGTFDVSIIHLKDKEISVIVTNGDDHLGGEDITHRLEEYVINDIKETLNIDISNNNKLKLRIHNVCENTKIALSFDIENELSIHLSNDEDYSKTITRAKLTELCKDLFEKTINVVNETLNKARMNDKDIDYIVLVGGSSVLPQVTEYINKRFKDIPICKSVNADEAVAIGCGIYANYKLYGNYPYKIIDFIPPTPISFGIDLGNSFCCGAYYKYCVRNYEVISTGQIINSIPSVVAFDKMKDQVKIGYGALNSMTSKCSFAADAKRYICRYFKGVDEMDLKFALYNLVETAEGYCQYEVEYNNAIEYYSPTRIISLILRHIKEMAIPQIPESNEENQNEFPVVLTVPTDFSFLQREEIKKAANEAGLKIIHLINEPTAAAFAYIWNNEIRNDNRNIMVYDFGGKSFNVSILNVNGDEITLLNNEKDENLGGEDISNRLCDYLISKVEEETGNVVDESLRKRIRKESDEIKKKLSLSESYDFEIEIDDDNEYMRLVTRSGLEELCKDLLDKTVRKCCNPLILGKIDKIDYIILVGGSSRIPAVEEILRNSFEGIPICRSINQDEAVAIGAALYGRSIQDERINHYKIVDVLSRAIGVSIGTEIDISPMKVVIEKCTKLPAKGSTIVTCKKGIAVITILEGDGESVSSQIVLEIIKIEVMSEWSNVEIYFEVNIDGILHVKAKCNGIESSADIDLSHPIYRRMKGYEFPKVKLSYGIDLGTTFSSASFINSSGQSKMIDPLSGRTIPSCVYYDENKNEIKVGETAINSSKNNPSNLLYNSKRFLSKYYSDLSKKEIDSFPFKLIRKYILPFYEIKYNNEIKQVNPIEVSSEIVKHIHKISLPQITHEYEKLTSDDIHVVIGIPAHFNKQQREVTIEAARLAGLKNIELITEPSAAALTYVQSDYNQIIKKNDCNILVYDFGGGTFDVSIIHLKNKEISIKSTFGDDHLGGEDITHRLEEYIKDNMNRTLNIDISNNKLKLRIHNKCDELKIALSSTEEFEISIDLPNDEEYSKTITRTKLTELCKDLFERTIDVVNKTLNKAEMNDKDIDYIVLVGGSSRLPQVTEYINERFKNIPICKSVNADEAVAIGCGIYANYRQAKNYPYKIVNNLY